MERLRKKKFDENVVLESAVKTANFSKINGQ
jgi:hypothetical protein